MTLPEPTNQPSADLDGPTTHVMIAPVPASPVFVDSTGRRRRLLRRASYGFGVLCMLYGGLVSVSLAGGPVSPNAVLPLQVLADGGSTGELAKPQPIPEPATKSAAAKPKTVEQPKPRRTTPTHTLERAVAPKPPTTTKPHRTTAPPKTTRPTKRPVTKRPVESATTKPPTSTPTPSSTTPTPSSAAPSTRAAAPKPPTTPASTSTGGGTGGAGGGGEVAPIKTLSTPTPTAAPTGGPEVAA